MGMVATEINIKELNFSEHVQRSVLQYVKLTTVTPNMMTNRSDANPITIPAIAHWGRRTSSSGYIAVATVCFGSTVVKKYMHFKNCLHLNNKLWPNVSTMSK